MTAKEFFKNFDLSTKGIKVRKSENKYEETDVNIRYIRLSRPVDEQDFLVFSRTSAESLVAGTTKLAEMQITKGDNGKWGIIMPDTSEVEMTIDLE